MTKLTRSAVREIFSQYLSSPSILPGCPVYRFVGDWAHLGKYDYSAAPAPPSKGVSFVALIDRNLERAATCAAWDLPPLIHDRSCKPTGPQGRDAADALENPDVEKRQIEHPDYTVLYWSITTEKEREKDVALLEVKLATARKRSRQGASAAPTPFPPPESSPPHVEVPAAECVFSPGPPPIELPPQPVIPADRSVLPPSEEARGRLLASWIKAGDLQRIREALTEYPDLRSVRLYHYSFTLLHEACREQQLDIIRMLVNDFGLDPNACAGENQATSLHQAAHRGVIAAVAFLLERGAHPNALTTGGWLPVHNASHQGHKEAVDLLLQRYAPSLVFRSPGRLCNMWQDAHPDRMVP